MENRSSVREEGRKCFHLRDENENI